MDRQTPQRRSPKTLYLILYNLVSALLWLSVLGRVVLLVPLVGHENVYDGTGQFAKWTQTLALVEIVHSLLGVVRSPLLTTAMQVASRLVLVWGIVDTFPGVASSPAYSSMLTAWAVSEVVRYSYFVLNLRGGVPEALTWLRYNAFFILYPLGIGSEMWLVYLATGPAGKIRKEFEWGLYAILLLYVPGSYVLYTHMMAQRRKIMRGKQRQRTS